MKNLLIQLSAGLLFLSPILQADTIAHSIRNQLEMHFQSANKNIGYDNTLTARHVRRAADILNSDTERAWGAGKKELENAVNELKNLADRIEDGAITRPRDLQMVFAKSLYAHHKETRLAAGRYAQKIA